MSIRFYCTCGRALQASDIMAGETIRCLACDKEILVPDAPTKPPVSKLAIASLLLGISSFVPLWVNSALAVILGIVAYVMIRSSKQRLRGEGIAVMGALLGILAPVLTIAVTRDPAGGRRMTNNMKPLILGMYYYHEKHHRLPEACTTDTHGNPLLSWRVQLLPFVEQTALYQQFNLDEPWDSPHNIKLLPRTPKTFLCPDRPDLPAGMTYFQVITTPRDLSYNPKTCALFGGPTALRIPDSFPDGLNNTIVIVEGANPVPWTKPEDVEYRPGGPLPNLGDPMGLRFSVGLGDGSVRSIVHSMSKETLRRAIVPADGLPLGPDW